MKIVFGIVIVLLVLVAWAVSIYNRLVKYRNRYKNAYAQIDVQLKRRYDLIPNLVETAKGYMAHERETLQAVIEARNQAAAAAKAAAASPGAAQAMLGLAGAEGLLTGALGKLMVSVEAYPDLKADRTMAHLMEELTSTENRVAFARQAFNDMVTAYNDACETFPGSVFAGMFGFQQAQLLELDDPAAREAVKVSLT